jgi:hypothetical protein
VVAWATIACTGVSDFVNDPPMKIIETSADAAVIELTTDELRIASSAINEICNGPDAIEEWSSGRAPALHLPRRWRSVVT